MTPSIKYSLCLGLHAMSAIFATAAAAQQTRSQSAPAKPNAAGIAPNDQSGLPAGDVADPNLDQMFNMPLEDLLTMETTSVARKRQRVADSAAAVFVITQEDIEHSSATTIPELLRMAPGIEVAQIQNGELGVTARGFNSSFANSLLVLIDGRAIYCSTLSGVLWNQQLLPLSEIERIEIVRGPGATLWGSNAVNGVINIISKHAGASRGITVSGSVGNRSQQLTLSYNGILGENLAYRFYGKLLHDNGLENADGSPLARDTSGVTLGWRADYEPSSDLALTVQADYARGRYGEVARLVNTDVSNPGYTITKFDSGYSNFSLLGRVTRRVSDKFDYSFQTYVNRTYVNLKGLAGAQTTINGDVGVRYSPSDRHEVNFGLSGQLNLITVQEQGQTFRFATDRTQERWLSGYIQDDIWVVPERLRLTIGSKIEYNSSTGFEYQPSAKILFRPNADHTIWAGVSRSTRTPSIYERYADFYMDLATPFSPSNPTPFPVYVNVRGNPRIKAEHMVAYEIGLRGKIAKGWTYDLAAYRNIYKDLNGPVAANFGPLPMPSPVFHQSNPLSPPPFELTTEFENAESASTWGVEGLVSGEVRSWWQVSFAFSHLTVTNPGVTGYLKPSPRNQFSIRTSIDLTDNLTISGDLRRVGRLEAGPVPAYTELNLRARQQLTPNLQLSLVGNNLLSARHAEYYDPRLPSVPAYVPRAVSLQLFGRF